MLNELLKEFTFLDFTHRLPGPLAGHILSQMGARVLKIEDVKFKDSFLSGEYAHIDESFPLWYENLNKDKEILRFDFKKDQSQIWDLVKKSQGIIHALPPKVLDAFEFNAEKLNSLCPDGLAVIEMGASQKIKKFMHDLNALAHLQLLELEVNGSTDNPHSPPLLPFAGISFGQQVALDLVSLTMKAIKDKKVHFHQSYLFESCEASLSPFYNQLIKDKLPKMKSFLHNGRYPCYNLYRLKDGAYLVFAAVEEKFFAKAKELFNLPLEVKDRFSTETPSHEKMATAFAQLSREEVEKKLEGQNICLDLV